MWVAEKAGVDPRDELAFTMEKINANFSNYSAWHYRSKLLPRLGMTTLDHLGPELELVQQVPLRPLTRTCRRYVLPLTYCSDGCVCAVRDEQALYTEPDDQSAWFYHRWLVAQVVAIKASGDDETQAAAAGLLEAELERLAELWEAEEEKCKCKRVPCSRVSGPRVAPHLTSRSQLVRVCPGPLVAMASVMSALGRPAADIRAHYTKLSTLDPGHSTYYRDTAARLTASEA